MKIICLANCIRSVHQPIFRIRKLPIHPHYKHWNRTDGFHCKRNKFIQFVLCSECLNQFWLHWVSGSRKIDQMESTSMLVQLAHQICQLHCPSSIYRLMLNDCLPKAGRQFSQRCHLPKLCFYHQFADGPVYTLNTDDRLVESRFASVFHPSPVKLDASFARIPLLQINHFSTHSFTDKNCFLSSSINIKSLT